MGLMAENVESIAVMTEQNMKVVELTTDTVQHLNKMVHRMEKAVKQYSV
jgi:methyl-accepting chemotaxis protein